MEAIILAGGKGTRLQSAVRDVPKPMAPVHGRPFIEYLMDYWMAQGVRHFVLAIGYKGEVLQKHFGSRYNDAEISFSCEEYPLGTGGGLFLAAKALRTKDSFLILNGDTFFEVNLDLLRSFHRRKKPELTMAVLKVPFNSRYGAVRLGTDSEIIAYQESNPNERNIFVNGGVYLADMSALNLLPWASGEAFSLENDFFPYCLKSRRRIYGFEFSGRFLDIGIPEDYRAASNFLSNPSRII
jgi:D-glycero-alpha-D-manno-heptose 1-phosphate guanylyltransferase